MLNFCATCAADVEASGDTESSTKIRKIISILKKIRDEDPAKKTIIFSQARLFPASRSCLFPLVTGIFSLCRFSLSSRPSSSVPTSTLSHVGSASVCIAHWR
jgi:hypothetical protein